MPIKHEYFTYITTNPNLSVLYVGVTNDLHSRLTKHRLEATGERKTFAGRYNCIHYIYYEMHNNILTAIAREKEIKGWNRQKKLELVYSINPLVEFLETKW